MFRNLSLRTAYNLNRQMCILRTQLQLVYTISTVSNTIAFNENAFNLHILLCL